MATSYGVSSSDISSLFVASSTQSSQLDSFAQTALVKGLQYYSNGRYSEAIGAFRQAIGYSPTSSNAINAYDYMAKSYLQQGDTQAAIDTYKRSIRADSSQDATHTSLANIYYSQGDYSSALVEYQKAAKLNGSSANLFSLGQGYLADGQYNNAMREFAQVKRLAPNEPYGDFGMGQAYAKQGQYDQAIGSFQRAIGIDPTYWDAYSEMGYAMADAGQIDQAQSVVDTLTANGSSLASQLGSYIYTVTQPKITDSYYSNMAMPFLNSLGPGTQVSNLGGLALMQPDGQQTFSIVFQFNKDMDQSSVENVLNWTITRAANNTLSSQNYNYGAPAASTEVDVPYTPAAVVYDASALTATVFFKVAQNSSGNGTIDPSHIKFSFNGTDAFGMKMDSTANEYTGFSGVA